jgi:hypothetical protein
LYDGGKELKMATNEEPKAEAVASKPRKEWYQSCWGVLVIILFLPYFGIWYIWAKTKMNKTTKWVLTGLISLFLIIVGVSVVSSSPTSITTTTNTPSKKASSQKVIYDLPPLMSKNADEVKTTLGAPKSTYEPNQQQLSAGVDEGSIDYEKDGQELLVTYNAKTRAIIDFFLSGEDKDKLLASGNLSEKNNDYLTEVVKQIKDASKITGVKASKKLSQELDGAVNYNLVAFQISNNENYNWSNCKLKLNDKYKEESGIAIMAKDKAIVNFSNFTTSDGTRFSFLAQDAKNLYISCDTNLNKSRYNYFVIK